MITRAFLQEYERSRIEPETRMLEGELARRGIATARFTHKQLDRRKLPLGRDALVAGSVPVVEAALRQLGVEPPTSNCYPEALRPYLRRQVWESTGSSTASRGDCLSGARSRRASSAKIGSS